VLIFLHIGYRAYYHGTPSTVFVITFCSVYLLYSEYRHVRRGTQQVLANRHLLWYGVLQMMTTARILLSQQEIVLVQTSDYLLSVNY